MGSPFTIALVVLTLLPLATFQWKVNPRNNIFENIISTKSSSDNSLGRAVNGYYDGLCRVGIGYDIHKIVDCGRTFKLGGVVVSDEYQIDAHSDGDVLYHAIADAIFGALGKGDIGQHFPNTPKFDNINSSEILDRASTLTKEGGYKIYNIDAVVILQKVILQNYISEMVENVKKSLSDATDNETVVSVKGKTKEGLDSTGRGLSVECHTIVTLRKIPLYN
ncbi:2-C-methyl-D-erythritol 2,4-cyclodiphosphate synthase [Babesia microti strain RI]|uniref:2-C-methyl-D-erythritol 2,4-cyclodiphosphate synthase n=1 Tax=Babesia microti (strain RI) TaxID=1133968 RepID=I7I9K5_BABMR|nr:2-C-methyl-D-erythritol 2,4-cyclodiphosphate synthase [Babesia microti strain RI]CCF75199.1 2-C-methyl-D-erythritol 2,4-cyclodiphosphate synthase [Babesia microti strain RI]|eukprot:XP_012649607.1 2-C-methyl-D-erythritol 2,4-cyclodiphosphate synthase [Babesia microti strain RI]